MAVDYFIMFNGSGVDPVKFREHYKAVNGPPLSSLPGARVALLHTPKPSHDPFLADKDPPLLLVQVSFESREEAEAALVSPAAKMLKHDYEGVPVKGGRISHELLQTEPYATATSAPSEVVTAPVSYFVHYRRPVDDEEHFLDHYRAGHVPILAQFPGLRSLTLYTPTRWRSPIKMAPADHFLVCQIAFDSLDALNDALASEVRVRLREDYYGFPKHGEVSHYAMLRDQVYP